MTERSRSSQGRVASIWMAGPVCVVVLAGRLSTAQSRVVSEAVEQAAGKARAVVVDLSDVLLIDTAVARTLRTCLASQVRRGGVVAAAEAHGQPLEVLEVLGIVKEIGAHRTLDEAIDDVRCGNVDTSRQSIEVSVHRLMTAAASLPERDPRRRELETKAIEAALPLARTLAHRYAKSGEPMDDLVQVASLGVVRSVQGYRADHGSGFLAYAVPTILGELKRHFRDHAWAVRAPRRLQELRSLISQTSAELAQELGREPTNSDIADRLDVGVAEVEHAVATTTGLRPASLDAPAGAGTERVLHETVGSVDPDVELVEYRSALKGLIAGLPPNARELLSLRFSGDLTQSEIASRLGTSQMNVSRMLSSILTKFRLALLATE
jgi:RNA polymerase sigma-B factor